MHRIGKELPRMRVLLVDRHASARNTLRMILSTLGAIWRITLEQAKSC